MTANRADLIACIDCETTGLDAVEHEVWEVAVLLWDRRQRRVVLETVWQLPVRVEDADPEALAIGRFEERRWPDGDLADPAVFAEELVAMTAGLPLVGCVPSFDEVRLRRIVECRGLEPAWHYRPICVETLAVGWLMAKDMLVRGPGMDDGGDEPKVPWRSALLSELLGVPRPEADAHTALGDCRWALAMWQTVMGEEPPT